MSSVRLAGLWVLSDPAAASSGRPAIASVGPTGSFGFPGIKSEKLLLKKGHAQIAMFLVPSKKDTSKLRGSWRKTRGVEGGGGTSHGWVGRAGRPDIGRPFKKRTFEGEKPRVRKSTCDTTLRFCTHSSQESRMHVCFAALCRFLSLLSWENPNRNHQAFVLSFLPEWPSCCFLQYFSQKRKQSQLLTKNNT